MPAGEFAAIARFERLFGPSSDGEVGIGDDAAVLRPPAGRLLLATDTLVEGVHFDLDLMSLSDVGWKAVVVNVSDIAAMGGRALHAVVSVAGPSATDLDALYAGIVEAAQEYRVQVVGGDLTNAPLLVVTVALTGGVDGEPVLRSGANAGDAIWVTGPLGASAAALRAARGGATGAEVTAYRRPRARATQGPALAHVGATAMIDVSDGLAADVSHIAERSGVGIALEEVPVVPGATEDDALGGGEDFELVFTMPPGVVLEGAELEGCLRIGTCTADAAVRTLRGAPLHLAGWEHAWDGEERT